ncbi:hypothetical protein WMY93_027558 [Mugilogobius chulae]|uniref:PH domain-containing protein n=1 Tax=Mugilogobius chulae TaxID=88201 RepID=A0AAW0N267_9GOBI
MEKQCASWVFSRKQKISCKDCVTLPVHFYSIQIGFGVFGYRRNARLAMGDHMNPGGTLQQRTTYLISLTLVKVEAVDGENGAQAKDGSVGKGEEAAGLQSDKTKTQNGAEDGKTQAKMSLRSPLANSPVDVSKAAQSVLPIQAEKSLKSCEAKQCKSPEVVEPCRTPTRTSLPIRPAGQRPVSLLKSHSSAASRGRESREGRERSPTSAQSLDRKDCRVSTRSPGPCRASWAETSRTEMWRDEVGIPMDISNAVLRDLPRKERLKASSTSLPAPANQVPKSGRKGKSRTLDNSDLNSLSEDLGLAPQTQQRASAKDRKMLKFISGIFTKSSSGGSGSSSATPSVYIQRDSSEEEGGRFKKEVLVDGQSHLLLIREEPGPPDAQFCGWVDALILVFSLENEASFQELYSVYAQLSALRSDLPVIVVGTQDKISSSNPRVIEDQRARQLCIDVRHSLFYETCATYGFNVERVFSEAAQKVVAQRKQAALQACKSLPNSPSHSGGSTPGSASFPSQVSNGPSPGYTYSLPSTPVVSHRELRVAPGEGAGSVSRSLKSIPRRPSLFKNRDQEKKSGDSKADLSTNRGVPIKQSILYKRSGSSLNKEWKKKYVTLSNTGTLSYHSSSSDFSQNTHGKDIDLLRVTVKVPGKRPPRAVAPTGPSPAPPAAARENGISKEASHEPTSTVPQLCPNTLSVVEDRTGGLSPVGGDRALSQCSLSLSNKAQSVDALEGTAVQATGKDSSQSSPMTDRKKTRRKKSMTQKGDAAVGQAEAKRKMWKLKSFGSLRNINKTDEENSDFIIVSFTGQTWHFEAQNQEERDSWVSAIESQILASLQSCESGRNKARRSSQSEAVALQAIRNAKGNGLCVDCEAPSPGRHRNHTANSIWESCTQGRSKPTPNATREERESWIRAKYEQRTFVAPLGPVLSRHLQDQHLPDLLLSAVTDRDLPRLLLLLAHSNKDQINPQPSVAPSGGTALHAACSLGDVVMTQLLVWYGVDVKLKDELGQTALMLARKTGSKGCVDILLQHGCSSETSPTTATPVLSRRYDRD